jgi:hypothetical protein
VTRCLARVGVFFGGVFPVGKSFENIDNAGKGHGPQRHVGLVSGLHGQGGRIPAQDALQQAIEGEVRGACRPTGGIGASQQSAVLTRA